MRRSLRAISAFGLRADGVGSAEERIREKKSQIEFAHSQAELARAMAKLKVARKSSASLGR